MLLFGPTGSVLLLHASLSTEPDFWACPGGGVEAGETWEQAAHREVNEETGLLIMLGPLVWYRRHVFSDRGHNYDLYERFFVGRSTSEQVKPSRPDSYIRGHRWWPVDELLSANAVFAPRRLKERVLPIARGEYPEAPFNCGI